jgi:hypothetical protein
MCWAQALSKKEKRKENPLGGSSQESILLERREPGGTDQRPVAGSGQNNFVNFFLNFDDRMDRYQNAGRG